VRSEERTLGPERVPPRFGRPSPLAFVVLAATLAFLVHGLTISELTPARFVGGLNELVTFLSKAFPPSLERMGTVARSTLETFEMAVVGTVIGAILSLPLALLAARNTSPHAAVYGLFRALITFLRAVPDLVWGLVFVVAVGLGPAAGILAITVDVIGLCGRFYAERIEEIPPGPSEALRATGATPLGVIAGAVVPAALPSFVATTLFALEGATRSAVVLGLVGAGGIGIELSTSIQLLNYDEALTIILIIFAVIVGVERLSATIRRRVI
jgi:phosphonate transport system permease protein